MELWCEHWNIKINEDKILATYFSHWCTSVEAFLTLKVWQVPLYTMWNISLSFLIKNYMEIKAL
jgi:hypothetical protein